MKYEITIGNQLMGLRAILVLLIFLICSVFYFENNHIGHLWGAFCIVYISSLIPVLYLHLEYYYFNRGNTLSIESFENKLIYCNKLGEIKTIYFNEINKIQYYMDPTWYRKSDFRILPFARYHYAKICIKGGEKIIITSLMIPRIEDAFAAITGVTKEKHIRLYSSILIDSIIDSLR